MDTTKKTEAMLDNAILYWFCEMLSFITTSTANGILDDCKAKFIFTTWMRGSGLNMCDILPKKYRYVIERAAANDEYDEWFINGTLIVKVADLKFCFEHFDTVAGGKYSLKVSYAKYCTILESYTVTQDKEDDEIDDWWELNSEE